MVSISAEAFFTRVRTLSRDELLALVEGLWTARGWTVERKNVLLVAHDSDSGAEEVIHPIPARVGDRVIPPREPIRGPTTTVVLGGARPPSWAASEDVRVLDRDELYQMLQYGVDRETRRELLSDVLGVKPSEFETDPQERGTDSQQQARDKSTEQHERAASIAILTLAVLFFALVGAVTFGVGPLGTTTEAEDDVPTLEIAPSPQEPLVIATPAPPPGVTGSGVENPDALAFAHITRVGEFSYTMTFEYREVGETHTGTIRETIEVVDDRRYLSRLTETGTFEVDPDEVTDRALTTNVETYANGNTHFERRLTDGDVQYDIRLVQSGHYPLHDARAGGFIQRTFRANNTTTVERFEQGGVMFYQIEFTGSQQPAFEDLEGGALVDEHGMVHYVRKQYRLAADPSVTITVTMAYSDLRSTHITEPPWVSDAINETQNSA